MGKMTHFNEGIRKWIEKGFRRRYGILEEDRLLAELLDEWSKPYDKFAPDRFEVRVHSALYHDAFRGSEEKVQLLQTKLEKELLETAQRQLLPLKTLRITVVIKGSSLIAKGAFQISSRVSRDNEIMTIVKPPEYYLQVQGKKRKLEIGKSYAIGRGKECQIIIARDNISRRHALLELTANEELYLSDLESRNKTFLNDNTEPINGRVRVKPGDVIRLAKENAVRLTIEKR